MGGRRSGIDFAFGNFDIEGGFAVSHQYDRSQAIVRPGAPVNLRVRTVPEYSGVEAFVLEGLGPFTATEIRNGGTAIRFYRSGDDWVATLPGRPDHVIVNYVIAATHRSGAVHHGDGRLPLERARIFTHRVTSRIPPAWTEDAVVYQIFVDRFADTDGPVPTPDHEHAFAGGDLHGVTAKLDWIADLGIDCIWLTPIFTCESYHGYDAIDLKAIDPRFGGDDALRTLVQAAHARGIRILLDLVPNHLSHRHAWFESARRGGPERDWFFFDADDRYQMFFSSHTMPKVNLDHPDARAAMIDVASHWLSEFDVDGYRIDHALGPSESFFAALSEAVERIKPDAWLFGEVTSTPLLSRRYGGVLDGVTDFPFAYGLREFLGGGLDPEDFAEIERESAAAVDPSEFSWVRFVDNHDMARAIHGWSDDQDILTHALDIMFSLPGVPSIFYGTEQGLSHRMTEAEGGLSVGRVPMTFDPKHPMVDVVRSAIAARRASGSQQATPMYWAPDGSWTWGTMQGSLRSGVTGFR